MKSEYAAFDSRSKWRKGLILGTPVFKEKNLLVSNTLIIIWNLTQDGKTKVLTRNDLLYF